jgi:hypothetical protein
MKNRTKSKDIMAKRKDIPLEISSRKRSFRGFLTSTGVH